MATPAPAEAFDTVHALALRDFPELVAQLGGNVAALGVGAAALERVTYRDWAELLDRAARRLGCPDFGMRLARRQSGGGMFGPLGAVMRHSRNYGEALDYVTSHAYAHSLAARIWRRALPGGEGVFVGHDILLGAMPGRAQLIEQVLLGGHLGAMALTDGRARVRRVHLRHQPIAAAAAYRRHFGCDVLFGQDADGVVFSAADLAAPIEAPDRGAYQSAVALIAARFTRRRAPLHAETRGLVMRWLAQGDCSNARVAAALALHPRTLHRRLGAEGTSFQQIKDEVRREALLYYLAETRLDLAQISERLGFAEQSVMTRRCRRWFGASPSALRARAGIPAPDAILS